MIESKIAGYPIILPEHRHAFHSERPDWHKAWLDSIHESLKPDDVVIDVGAEQGDLSALVASWVPDGGIVLVEPQPLFWPTIRETFEANGLKHLAAFDVLVSDDPTEDQPTWGGEPGGWPIAAIEPPMADPGFYHLNEHDTPVRMTVDQIISHVGLSAIRYQLATALIIDVEGSELHVLHSAEIALHDLKPLVWCAIHPEIMRDRYGHDPNELLAYMYRLGYRWDFLGFQGELHFKFTPR